MAISFEFPPLLLIALTPLAIGLLIGAFFFITTRASLMVMEHRKQRGNSHVYWIYRSPLLIWLLDRQFISSVILLFQYHRLVKRVLAPACARREGKRILQVSCVFGNFTQKLAACYHKMGEVFIFDIMHSEVRHASRKLAANKEHGGCCFFQGDAASMPFQAGIFDYVVSFFLFHELPPVMKQNVFAECLRVLKPGGIFVYGEFHKPDSPMVGMLSGLYFWIFEPYARAMWSWNPTAELDPLEWHINRTKVMGGYFQVVSLERLPVPVPVPESITAECPLAA
jgi:ubiquinone/menaquinone biosynthesis C-methylase UbiE